jgi:Transposase DDE domain
MPIPIDPEFPTEPSRPADLAITATLDPRLLLSRLPLADAVLAIAAQILHRDSLDSIFREHRGRCFEHLLSFEAFVSLIGDALLEHRGSGRQCFQRAQERGELPTSIEAVYGKLRRVPVPLSLGFLEQNSARLRELLPSAAPAWTAPACLDGLNPIVLDGKTLKKVAKRLKAARGALGKVSGGKLLVAMDPGSGLVLAMAADPDGEANEARLVPELLPRLAGLVPGRQLWIADRQFGDPVQIARFLEQEGDHVVVRYDGRTTFHVDPGRAAPEGRDAKGRAVIQDWGWLGAGSNKRRRYVRRIALIRPGEESIILVTDLLEEADYPAADLLEVYLARWGIERVFQQITEVFALGRLIGGTPQATIFQAAFCLLLYNMIQAVRAWIAEAGPEGCRPEDLSGEQIFYDMQRQLIVMSELVGRTTLAAAYRPLSPTELRDWLGVRLAGVWTARWKKAANRKQRGRKPEVGPCHGAHNSVHRLIEQHKARTKPP